MTHAISPRNVFGLAQGLMLAAALGAALMVAAAVLPGLVGLVSLVVISGSMQPSLHVGDMVVTRQVEPESLRTGDVITYRSGKDLNTHRIVGIDSSPEGIVFRTKGDANSSPDMEPVPSEQVLAKVIYRIPYVGYLVNFVDSRLGRVLFIVVPIIVLGVLSMKQPRVRVLRLPAFLMRMQDVANTGIYSSQSSNKSHSSRGPITFREPWLNDTGKESRSSQRHSSRSPIKWRGLLDRGVS